MGKDSRSVFIVCENQVWCSSIGRPELNGWDPEEQRIAYFCPAPHRHEAGDLAPENWQGLVAPRHLLAAPIRNGHAAPRGRRFGPKRRAGRGSRVKWKRHSVPAPLGARHARPDHCPPGFDRVNGSSQHNAPHQFELVTTNGVVLQLQIRFVCEPTVTSIQRSYVPGLLVGLEEL